MKKPADDNGLIVVTGGAGFIGSCLVRELNDRNISNIVIVDRLAHKTKWKNLVGKSFREILDKDQLMDWMKGRERDIRGIYHLGACSDTMETDASYLLENNYRYSINLIEEALRFNIPTLYASSASTYGDGSEGFSDQKEIERLRPLNMYAYSKQLVDLWLLNEGLQTQVVGIKFFNVFGPNEEHKGRMASAITRMLPQILREGKVSLFKSNEPSVYADGEQKRDFLYVKDAVKVLPEFMELLSKQEGGLFNLGSGIATSWNALATAVFEATNLPVKIDYIDMPSTVIGYQNYSCSDNLKTESYLQKQIASRSIKEAVKEYVNDYLLPVKKW